MRHSLPSPATVADLGRWDETYSKVLKTHGASPRALRLLRDGCVAVSDYSGFDSPRECFRTFLPAITRSLGREADPALFPLFLRSSDWGAVQQNILTQQSQRFSEASHCVMDNMQDRLQGDATSLIMAMAPTARMTLGQAEAANKAIHSWLLANRQWAAPANAFAPCLMHGGLCPANPMWAWQEIMKGNQLTSACVVGLDSSQNVEAWWKRLKIQRGASPQ